MNNRQPPQERWNPNVFLPLLWLMVLGSLAASCTSIYRRAEAELPPDPGAEVSLRVTEARKAAGVTEKAGAKLLEALQGRKSPAVTETAFDRLEAAAFDFDRRVGAARDAAERQAGSSEASAEIERLNRLTTSWLDYVNTQRAGDPTTRLRTLQNLLPGRG